MRDPWNSHDTEGNDILANPFLRAGSFTEALMLGKAFRRPVASISDYEFAASAYLDHSVRSVQIDRFLIFAFIDLEFGHWMAQGGAARFLRFSSEKQNPRKRKIFSSLICFLKHTFVPRLALIQSDNSEAIPPTRELLMHDAWQIARSDGKIAIHKLRYALDKAEAAGVVWPTSLYALIADLETRERSWI